MKHLTPGQRHMCSLKHTITVCFLSLRTLYPSTILLTTCDLCRLTPVLVTPEHDSREEEAHQRTQTEGSLCPSPALASLLHSPPAPDSDQTAESPSTPPGRSLRRKVCLGKKQSEQSSC